MPTGLQSSAQLEAGVQIGDFRIEKRLGAGGMGIVYKAQQVSLDRIVALKVLGPALTRSADLERFQREAKAAARLKHPGITAIHFIGQDSEVCYHVMEYVNGVPLQRLIDRLGQSKVAVTSPDSVVADELTTQQTAPVVRFDAPTTVDTAAEAAGERTADFEPRDDRGRISISSGGKQTRGDPQYVRRCCEIVRDVARALAYAHSENVVHRDIKPENLMLDQGGQVRIIDFGLARYFDDDSITSTGQLVGTPLYMSPEQVTGRFKVDHRTDIYSLGLVLYELLALRRPFEVSNRENLLRDIVTKALPPLSGRNLAMSKELEAIVHKAASKDLEERYQSAAEFADELDSFLAGKPVSAPPYRYRLDFQEVLSRRPGGVVLASFITLLLGCTLFVAGISVAAMTIVIAEMNTVAMLVGVAQTSAFVLVLAGSCWMALGLLAGRNWARWVVIVVSVLALLGLIGGLAFLTVSILVAMNQEPPATDQKASIGPSFLVGMLVMYSIPMVLAIGCLLTSLVCLFKAKTRAWFQLAGRARQEHVELLQALAD